MMATGANADHVCATLQNSILVAHLTLDIRHWAGERVAWSLVPAKR